MRARTIFGVAVGASTFLVLAVTNVAIAEPSTRPGLILVVVASLVFAAVGFRVWPWIENASGIGGCVERAVDEPRRAADADPWEHGRETLHQEYIPQVLHDMMTDDDATRVLSTEDFAGYRGQRRSLRSDGPR
jgi:hypothetical protein